MIMNILFIEDDKDLRESFAVFCKHKGCKLYCASTGEEGLKISTGILPDAIVLDMMLPGADGADICRRIKNDKKTSHIPVILYTSVRTNMGIDLTARDHKWLPADEIMDKCSDYNCLYKTIVAAIEKKKSKYS